MATRRTTARGMLATDTKAPIRTANPPINSTRMVAQAITPGEGTPRASRVFAKPLGPLESLASPCAMKPYPTIRRNGTAHQAAKGCKRDWRASFIVCTFRAEDPSRAKCVSRNRQLRRERAHVFNVRRRSQQNLCPCHEGCRDGSSQVLLASGLIRKRVEDSEAQGTEFQREPSGGTGLVLDEWKGRSKELLEFRASPRFCCQANQQTNCDHLNTALSAFPNLPKSAVM